MDSWYRSGTINVTNGSASVVGVLTTWTNQVLAGDLLIGPDGKSYEVAADPASNTALTISPAYAGTTATGQSYAIVRCSRSWGQASTVAAQLGAILAMLPVPASGEAGYGVQVKSGGGGYEVAAKPPAPAALASGDAYKFLRQNSAGSAYEAVALPLLFQGSGLLINGDFQINQRSFAGGSLASGVYGFDRWRATGASVMTLSGYVLTLSSGMITQFIEPAAFGLASLASTTITISVDTPSADLTVSAGSATGTITAGSGRKSITLTTGAGDTGSIALSISKATAGTVTFGRVKASLLPFDTTWTARPAATELQLCQRYYFALATDPFIDSYDSAGGAYYYVTFPFPTRMRATPTALSTLTGTANIYAPGGVMQAGAISAGLAAGVLYMRGNVVGRMYTNIVNPRWDAEI